MFWLFQYYCHCDIMLYHKFFPRHIVTWDLDWKLFLTSQLHRRRGCDGCKLPLIFIVILSCDCFNEIWFPDCAGLCYKNYACFHCCYLFGPQLYRSALIVIFLEIQIPSSKPVHLMIAWQKLAVSSQTIVM